MWHDLTPHEAQRTWRALAEWVGWLRGRYPLAHQVPLCWWRHPELVEELTALWLAWRDAYVEKGAPLSAPADWHGRWLPEFLRRIGAGGWNLACEGEHKAARHRPVRRPPGGRRQRSSTAPRAPDPDRSTAERWSRCSDDVEMHEAIVMAGCATRLGSLPDSPVDLRREVLGPER